MRLDLQMMLQHVPAGDSRNASRLRTTFAERIEEMTTDGNHMFNLQEAAIGYAMAAERMFGDDAAFVNANPTVVPIFVSMLFQSLEISIKEAGIASGLFSLDEARSRENRSGHGIKELAALAVEKLGGDPFGPIVMAMTFSDGSGRSAEFIRRMIAAPELEKTRDSYASRRLGYGQVSAGDFALINPIGEWIESVKKTALGLPTTVEILIEWKKKSSSPSKHFAIWLKHNCGEQTSSCDVATRAAQEK